MRVGEAHWLHRAVAQGFRPAFGHDLDRQAAIEIGCTFPLLEVGLVAFNQCGDEGLILLLVHGAVDIVLAGAAGANLVIAGLEPAHIHIDRIKMDDRRNGVEEGQSVRAGLRLNGLRQRRRGQGAGGNDGRSPFRRRQAGDFFPNNGNQRMGFKPGRDGLRKAFAVDGQRTASRNLMCIGTSHDERTGEAHLGMENADGIGFGIIRAERIGTDQLGKLLGLVGIGAAHRAHFVQYDGHARLRELPCSFRTGKATADDVNGSKIGCV